MGNLEARLSAAQFQRTWDAGSNESAPRRQRLQDVLRSVQRNGNMLNQPREGGEEFDAALEEALEAAERLGV